MDTSETYIKMCEDAKKYLPVIKPQIGQWWAVEGFKGWEVELVCEGERWQEPHLRPWADYVNDEVNGFDYESLIARSFPLYSQDQLQGMVDGWLYPMTLTRKFYLWLWKGEEPTTPHSDPSMEQLWLAFVMKEKYNKVWINNKWEVVND